MLNMRKHLLFSIALGLTIPSYSFAEKANLETNFNVKKAYFIRADIQSSIEGIVSDDSRPLAGVTVQVVGTGLSTVTDANGKYSIKATVGSTLRFSSVGYSTKDVKVVNTTLNVKLDFLDNSLGEVVVTALGIERNKKNLTYSVQTVSGDELRASNQSNILNGLQGQIAGAQISSSGGSPGLPTEIILRGSSTLTGDNQPLMIVDGIRGNNSSSESR